MSIPDKYKLAELVKELAFQEGALHCGISPAGELRDERPRLTDWLEKGFHGEMRYMENHFEKRVDPTKLVPGAKSVISLLFNYYPEKKLPDQGYKISKYAYGKDYHDVLRLKLKKITSGVESISGPLRSRVFTDSAPVLDRAWAREAGLGWIGKNTCLIHPRYGSFFFIAEIICDIELAYDRTEVKDFCGGCTRCIENCPTGAIISPRVLDSRKCISYLTIEYKGELPVELKDKFDRWIFGCDICQDVCPWNRIAKPDKRPVFEPSERLLEMNKTDWETLSEEGYKDLFEGSAVTRTGYPGLMRNINFVKE